MFALALLRIGRRNSGTPPANRLSQSENLRRISSCVRCQIEYGELKANKRSISI